MRNSYHLNTETYSLQKLKESLEGRKMIPSRTLLKKNLEGHFRILEEKGITNLKKLIDALKTKSRIEDFSDKTGLTPEYLTLLKREVNSYLPQPVALAKLPGIEPATIAALEGAGIKNTKHFYLQTLEEGKKEHLSLLTGLSPDVLNHVGALSDLSRLYGVGPVFAAMLYDAEIRSVETFARYTAEDFIRLYEKNTGKKADFNERDISFSIDMARELCSL